MECTCLSVIFILLRVEGCKMGENARGFSRLIILLPPLYLIVQLPRKWQFVWNATPFLTWFVQGGSKPPNQIHFLGVTMKSIPCIEETWLTLQDWNQHLAARSAKIPRTRSRGCWFPKLNDRRLTQFQALSNSGWVRPPLVFMNIWVICGAGLELLYHRQIH